MGYTVCLLVCLFVCLFFVIIFVCEGIFVCEQMNAKSCTLHCITCTSILSYLHALSHTYTYIYFHKSHTYTHTLTHHVLTHTYHVLTHTHHVLTHTRTQATAEGTLVSDPYELQTDWETANFDVRHANKGADGSSW